MTVEAAAYNAEQAATQCLFSHKRTLAQNIVAGEVVDFSSLAGDARTVQPGRAYSFDGVDDYVNVGITPFSGNHSYTYVAWIKPNSYGRHGIIGFGNYGFTGQVNAFRVSQASDVVDGLVSYHWGADDLFWNDTTNKLIDGNYHLVVVQYDSVSGLRRILVDNVEVATNYPSTVNFAASNNLTIGKTYIDEYFDGGMYGVAVYDRNLNAPELANIYNDKEYAISGLIAFYKTDESSGTTSYDSSGNGNHGTLVGGVTHSEFTDGTGTDYQNAVGYSEAYVADPAFANVSILTPLDVDILDDSTNEHTATVYGSAAISNAQSKFGTGSLHIPDTSSRLQFPDDLSLDFEGEDFTIELWFYHAYALVGGNGLLAKEWGPVTGSWTIYVDGSAFRFYASSSSASWDIATGMLVGVPTSNTWNHIAITRSGSTIRSFMNGVLQGSVSSALSIYNGTGDFVIGSGVGNLGQPGYYNEVRLIKGEAKYTSNFDVPTAPFPSTGAGANILVPRDESSITLDVLGNALQYSGRVPYNATIVGHDGTTDGFHSGCTLTFNPNGAPELAAYYGVTWTHGDPIPAGITADLGGDNVYRNIRISL